MKTMWQSIRTFAGIFVDTLPKPQVVVPTAEGEGQVKPIQLSFWLVLLVGIIAFFGFNNGWLQQVVPAVFGQDSQMNPYTCWELGALVWNAWFAIYFYWTVPLTGNRLVERFTSVAMLLGVGGCTFMALSALVAKDENKVVTHVFWVLLIGIVFLVIDGLHAIVQTNHHYKREFLQSLLLADLPMVPALGVLYYYQQRIQDTREYPKLELFLSGAISFQLIASTLIFACIQAGVFNHVMGRVSRPAEQAVAAQMH